MTLQRGEQPLNHSDEILSILREEIEQYDNRTRCDETGTVIEVGDGIATVYGLNRAVYGELVQFDTGVRGIVLEPQARQRRAWCCSAARTACMKGSTVIAHRTCG